MGPFNNIVVIGICLLLSTSLGTYMTFFNLPSEIEQLEKADQMARLQQSEVATLMSQESMTQDQGEEVIRRWRARYKTIPEKLTTADVVAELNSLTASGFKNFDVGYDQMVGGPNFNTHVFGVAGRGQFGALYDLVWALENQRQFFRVVDLELSHFDLVTTDPDSDVERLEILVSFSFELQAYFGGAAGLSAEYRLPEERMGENGLVDAMGDMPAVPRHVLPSRDPARNPFYPLILDNIPPNTHGLPDLLAEAELISIVGEEAVFDLDGRMVTLGVGDPVYLGQIVHVDPREGRVVARLNKGGIIDEIEMKLHTGERFRQALGPVQLAPSQQF